MNVLQGQAIENPIQTIRIQAVVTVDDPQPYLRLNNVSLFTSSCYRSPVSFRESSHSESSELVLWRVASRGNGLMKSFSVWEAAF